MTNDIYDCDILAVDITPPHPCIELVFVIVGY
jgi:hypothetical protein